MRSDYRMSHNACCVLLNSGRKVFIRLFIYTGGQYPEWWFSVVSANGNHSFLSKSYLSFTHALYGVLDFLSVTGACFELALRTTPFDYLRSIFSDVIYK